MRFCAMVLGIGLVAASLSDAADPVCQSFDASGFKTVVVRGFRAPAANTSRTAPGDAIRLCATPKGRAGAYHSRDRNWRETPPEEWGLAFVAKPFGELLLISSKNEIDYVHHLYYLDEIIIELPEALRLRLEGKRLNGNGAPDLSEPAPF